MQTFNPVLAEIFLGNGPFAITLVLPNGELLYANESAVEQLGLHSRTRESSVLPALTLPFHWSELIDKLLSGDPVTDEPVLIQTEDDDIETSYLTAFPIYNRAGKLENVVCIWATRRHALSASPDKSEEGTGEYTRDLEAIIEHRTYKHLLLAEQNQAAREVLDALPVGIMVVTPVGDITYLNRAMTDEFSLHPATYLKPNVRYFLRPDMIEAFDRVVETRRRRWLNGVDTEQKSAGVDLIPLVHHGVTDRVVLQYSRLIENVTTEQAAPQQ